jgi:hypothetical protein
VACNDARRRLAPEKLTPVRIIPFRTAPSRTIAMSGFSCRQIFHGTEPNFSRTRKSRGTNHLTATRRDSGGAPRRSGASHATDAVERFAEQLVSRCPSRRGQDDRQLRAGRITVEGFMSWHGPSARPARSAARASQVSWPLRWLRRARAGASSSDPSSGPRRSPP